MNLALLALRLVVGVLFIGHGTQKLFGAFGGSGLDGTAEGFERMGLRPGAWSLDAAFGWDLAGAGWALAALAAGLLAAIGALLGTRGWEHAHRDHGAGRRGAWRGPGGGPGAPRPHAR